ncbi:MAG: AraC family ligand binding domain-containing protein [Gammaproteobacteria bacterium]|nr:AraC family ligand binding domain-containing protein [Gammaproteobacteria bacterium]MDP2141646.1 AraC family ligand binding domain-containing protein [Gammaproteobacteria bacterium]MDP2346367.1 AraC family ligand binding domain-containing protein [Gammaproteobacteria bacterium]
MFKRTLSVFFLFVKPLTILTLGLLVVIGVSAQTPPVAPALYMKGTDIAAALQSSLAERPAMGASLITTSDHYRINLITRTEAHGAIVHRPGTELHFIVEGAGILTTGGTVNRPADGGPATTRNAVSQRVEKGDAILIPEGTPHHYTAVEGAITYLEVRFNVPVE